MNLDFLGLEAFVAIAERGSFQRAAVHLNLTQTALSHRLRKFEQELGLALLQRTTRQVSLTAHGRELLPKARRVIDDFAHSLDALRDGRAAAATQIAIGCLPTIAARYLPRLLGALSEAHPQLSVRIFDVSAIEIVDLVRDGTVEFGITLLGSHGADLDVKPLLKEPFVLLCPKGHALARHAQVTWSQLAGVPLVRVSPQTGNRALIDDALGAARERLTWRYEVQHVASAVSLVEAGAAATIVPRLAYEPQKSIVAVSLRKPQITRTLGLLTLRGRPLSPAGAALSELVQRYFQGATRRRS